MFSAADAARFVDEAHQTRAAYVNLPDGLAPRTLDEAYAAQEALSGLWEKRLGPVAGRKIATTTKIMQELMGIDHPCGGLIFASRIHRAPATIRKADYVNVRDRVRAGRAPRPRPAEGAQALHARERARRHRPGDGGLRADRGSACRLQDEQGAVADRRQRLERRHRHRTGDRAARRPRSERHHRNARNATASRTAPARPTIRSARWPGSPTWPPTGGGP